MDRNSGKFEGQGTIWTFKGFRYEGIWHQNYLECELNEREVDIGQFRNKEIYRFSGILVNSTMTQIKVGWFNATRTLFFGVIYRTNMILSSVELVHQGPKQIIMSGFNPKN